MSHRRRWRGSRSLWWLAVVAGCATASLRVEQAFVPSLFGDLSQRVSFSGDPELGSQFRAIWAMVEAGNLRQAGSDLERMSGRVAAEERHPLYVARGIVDLTADLPRAAMPWFDRALAVSSRYPPALLGKATGFHLMGDGDAALAWLDQLEAVAAGDVGGARLRVRARESLMARSLDAATAAESQRDLAGALVALRKALELDPGNPALLKRIGHLALATGDWTQAREAFEAITVSRPDDADAWVGLGETNLKSGNPAAAREAYERAAQLPGGLEQARERVEALREVEDAAREADPRLTQIVETASLDRASLATLLRARLPRIDRIPPRTTPAVITDVNRSWARRSIQDLVALGIMEVYDNHTFRPDVAVNRAMLAQTLARVINLYRNAGWLVEPRASGPAPSDIPSEHVQYHDVTDTLRYGLVVLAADGEFRPFEAASGADVATAIVRLAELLR